MDNYTTDQIDIGGESAPSYAPYNYFRNLIPPQQLQPAPLRNVQQSQQDLIVQQRPQQEEKKIDKPFTNDKDLNNMKHEINFSLTPSYETLYIFIIIIIYAYILFSLSKIRHELKRIRKRTSIK